MSKLLKKIQGYTLIETAIVLAIIGMLVGTFTSAYTIYVKDKEFKGTDAAVEKATNALISYVNIYGRYPCPAQPNLGRGQPGHGMELCAPDNDLLNSIPAAGNCFEYATAANSLTEGVCVEESTATVTDKRVLRGSLPFKALNLPEDETIDQYGNKLNYAVTYSMLDEDTFSIQTGKSGAVALVDDNDHAITNGAHFYVFSSGKNGLGAYTRGGVLSTSCPTSLAQENENCDTTVGDGTYRYAQKSDKAGNTFYDDQGYYRAQLNIQKWEYSDTNSADIKHKVTGKLVIGAPAAADLTTSSKVEVKGVVYADNGVIMSDQICDTTAKHGDMNPACFTSEMIGGQIAEGEGLQCPNDDIDGSGQYMVGIQNGRVICEDEIYVSCSGSTFIREIKADGSIVCSNPPPASCPPMTLTVCGDPITVGTRVHGSYGYFISGTCNEKDTPTSELVAEDCNLHGQAYKCYDGNWIKRNYYRNNYPCTCTEKYRTRNYARCTVGYTGWRTYVQKYNCPQQRWYWYSSVSNENCECDPGAINDRPGRCPEGLTGRPVDRYIMDCTDETWLYQGPAPTSVPCTCPFYEDDVNSIGCADGFKGIYEVITKWVCPDGVGGSTAGFWDTDNNITIDSCECDNSYVDPETDPCPAGEVGTIQMKYEKTWICDSATSGHFGERKLVANDCVPIEPPTCHWEATSTASPTGTPIGKPLGDTCECNIDKAPYGCYTGGDDDAQNYTCTCK